MQLADKSCCSCLATFCGRWLYRSAGCLAAPPGRLPGPPSEQHLHAALLWYSSCSPRQEAAAAMKVKASIKRLCEACRIVKRRGRLYVVCKENRKVRLVAFLQDEALTSSCITVQQACMCCWCFCFAAQPVIPTLPLQHKQRQGYHTDAAAAVEQPLAAAAAAGRGWLDAGSSIGARMWQGVL